MALTCRVDTASLITGACVVGNRGLGVLGSAVPSTGTSGAGYLYNDLALPGEANDEFYGLITSGPSGLTSFFAYEDSSFVATGPDGSYSFTYTGYKNGASYGSTTVGFTIGAAGTVAGRADETDTALALVAVQIKALGLATETDTAFALSAVQLTTTGLASEADTAFALSAGASTPVGLATETDSAFALSAVQLKAVGLSTETDSALTLSAARPAGLATETDTALTLTGLQIRGVGLASEASTALALAGLQLRATGLATETDIALARAPVQIRSAGLSTEVDTALALAPNVPGAVGLAVETDIALALAGRQIRAVGMATETDAALALTPIQRMAPGLALEIDASFALSAVQLRAVGLATETDTALALDPASTGGTADPADVWNYVLSNGLTAEETAVQAHAMLTALLASCPADLALVLKLLRNKQVTNPSTGRMTVYDDDGSTVLLEGNLFEDAAGAQPYRGQGAERRERLT